MELLTAVLSDFKSADHKVFSIHLCLYPLQMRAVPLSPNVFALMMVFNDMHFCKRLMVACERSSVTAPFPANFLTINLIRSANLRLLLINNLCKCELQDNEQGFHHHKMLKVKSHFGRMCAQAFCPRRFGHFGANWIHCCSCWCCPFCKLLPTLTS